MCGIAGVYSPPGNALRFQSLVQEMLDCIRHRGPDDEGMMTADQLLLGHRRLSIIDLNTGKQPLANEDNSVWVSFNGEIYNFRELRRDLLKRGHTFRTQTDSEVLVHLYEDFGIDFVNRLHGMFAFSLWDANTSSLYLVRDRLGVKPLYYMWHGERLYFASELKALALVPDVNFEVDIESIDHYLSYKYTPTNQSIFKQIKKLPPGSYLKCSRATATPKQYWVPRASDQPGEESDVAAGLLEATRSRLISDVPLGVSLSGGIDSAIVLANMVKAEAEPLRAFTAQFRGEAVDESELASETAGRFGAEHSVIPVERADLNELPRIVWHLDEPLAVYSAVPTYLLSHAQKKHATVILSGDGGDEAFGGYIRYRTFRMLGLLKGLGIAHVLRRMPFASKSRILSLTKRVGEVALLSPSARYDKLVSTFDRWQKQNIYSDDMARQLCFEGMSPVQEAFSNSPTGVDAPSYADYGTYLQGDVLHKVDRMSMAASVEVRSPFLDHRVVELGLSLPARKRYNLRHGKIALRQTYQDILPAKVLSGKKKGFSVPLHQWFSGDFSAFAHDILTSKRARERGYFSNDAILSMLNAMHRGETFDLRRLWSLLMLELWHVAFVDSSSPLER